MDSPHCQCAIRPRYCSASVSAKSSLRRSSRVSSTSTAGSISSASRMAEARSTCGAPEALRTSSGGSSCILLPGMLTYSRSPLILGTTLCTYRRKSTNSVPSLPHLSARCAKKITIGHINNSYGFPFEHNPGPRPLPPDPWCYHAPSCRNTPSAWIWAAPTCGRRPSTAPAMCSTGEPPPLTPPRGAKPCWATWSTPSRNCAIRAEIGRRLGAHVILENDANAAALGEKWMGAGRDVDDLVLLTLGTGVGGGIISGGRVLQGSLGMEIGRGA